MPDETETTIEDTTTETGGETTTTETAPAIRDFISDDGTFREGWIDALTPEDFRNAGDKIAYGAVGSVKDALKQLAHQNRLIQKQGKGVMPLGETPTPTEVEIYRRAMGIPDEPEGYNVQVPEGMADYYDEDGFKETVAALHAAHLTPAQVKAVMDLDVKRLKDGIESQKAADAAARQETETALKELWGDKFDTNLLLANRVIAETVTEEDREDVLKLIGNSVPVAAWIAKLGEAFLEDSPANLDGEPATGLSGEIDRLEATPGFASGQLKRENRKEHDRIVARLATLYARKYPEPATTT